MKFSVNGGERKKNRAKWELILKCLGERDRKFVECGNSHFVPLKKTLNEIEGCDGGTDW